MQLMDIRVSETPPPPVSPYNQKVYCITISYHRNYLWILQKHPADSPFSSTKQRL